jgi:integral membrane protein
MSGALVRFRVIAYVVGGCLILLTAGVVLRYGFDYPDLSRTVSPIHGFLYLVYLVAVFDLGRRVDWSLRRMLLVMLAGTVPLMSFYAERVVTRRWVGPSAGQPVATAR